MRALRNIAIGIVGVAFCIGAVVLPSYPARAALIDQGVTTLDDVTNLEWLDLTETIGQSYNSVAAGFGGFTTVQGFGFATASDVLILFTNAGVTSNAGFLPANTVPILNLLSLIGCTSNCSGAFFPFGQGFADLDTFNASLAARPFYQLLLETEGDFASAFEGSAGTFGLLGKDLELVHSGSWLVRSPVSAVPLPAALPLFGSALAMLGIVGWRRKRRPVA